MNVTLKELWDCLTADEKAEACACIWENQDEGTLEVRPAITAALAQVQRFRPAFVEKKTADQKARMLAMQLGRPELRMFIEKILYAFLLSKHQPMIEEFLNAQQIQHDGGIIPAEAVPPDVKSITLGIQAIRTKYPQRILNLYFGFALVAGDTAYWANLAESLQLNQMNIEGSIKGTVRSPAETQKSS